MATEGRVVSVREHQAGSELSADVIVGATTLVPVDIEEFILDGGQLTIGTEEEPITYTVDEDSDELTLATSLANAYSEDEPVLLYPPTVERWCAFVEPNGSETLEARVPHSLVPLLPLGIRTPGDATAEIVQADYVGTDLVLTDVLGKDPVLSEGKVRVPGFVSDEYESAVLALEPALYYRLGVQGIKDISGQRRDGTPSGGVIVGTATGLLVNDDDGATDFDGVNDKITVAGYSPFSDTAIRVLVGLADIVDDAVDYALYGDSGSSKAVMRVGANESGGLVVIRVGGTETQWSGVWPVVGEIAWFAVRYDLANDVIELFVNGESKGRRRNTGTYGALTNLVVGGSLSEAWGGVLDEFVVFERDISGAQLRRLYEIASGEEVEGHHGTPGYLIPEGRVTHIREGDYLVHTGTIAVDGTLEFDGRLLEVTEA